MRQDDGGRIELQATPSDFARVDVFTIDSSVKHLLGSNQAVIVVLE
jgi:hypothetical protein